VIITTVHLAKGLEFDEVIVCGVAASNYHSEVERSLLYIACTRAMHRLTVVWTGEKSPLLPAA
jgi:DNA helicase-2/ATP-dependent DNA helicase PcrA